MLLAIERGRQLVLIRKGGLLDPGEGFQLQAREFLFYPTYEHQTAAYIRPDHVADVDQAMAQRGADETVTFRVLGIAEDVAQCRQPDVVNRLSAHHIYNDQFVSQRLRWQPEQPLVIVTIRAYRLQPPAIVPRRPAYAGCKSWVELEQPAAIERADPVLDDATFSARRDEIHRIVEVARP